MKIVKYSKDNCPGCDELSIFCSLEGLVFNKEINVMNDMTPIERRQMAIRTVPLVVLFNENDEEIERVSNLDKEKIVNLFVKRNVGNFNKGGIAND